MRRVPRPVTGADPGHPGRSRNPSPEDHQHPSSIAGGGGGGPTGPAGGELGGTYPNPTVNATHSGSAHHAQNHTDTQHTDGPNSKPGHGHAEADVTSLVADLAGKSATGHTHTHVSTTGQTADDHHAKSHAHSGADGSGTVAHSATTGQTATDHHPAPAAGPDADITLDAAGAAGTAATFARSGHGHKLVTPIIGAYAPGSFTVPNGHYAMMAKRLSIGAADVVTLQGDSRLLVH